MQSFNYLLFDAAIAGEKLYQAISLNANHKSLYKGVFGEELMSVAPYLFDIRGDIGFIHWFWVNGWNQSWGVFLCCAESFSQVYNHFRKFLIVKKEDGKQLYFRFYDPRVLKLFLPTCDEQQIIEFFGPVEKFIIEGDSKEEAIEFTQENGILRQQTIPVSAVFGEDVIEASIKPI